MSTISSLTVSTAEMLQKRSCHVGEGKSAARMLAYPLFIAAIHNDSL
jgi:hypothetical protein